MRRPFDLDVLTLFLYRVEDTLWFQTMAPDRDGGFDWVLRRGTYLIARYDYRLPHPLLPRAAFQAAPGPAVVYVGTLRIDIDSDTNRFQVAVQDDFEQGSKALQTRNPKLVWPVAKLFTARDTNFNPSLAREVLVEALRARGLPILTTAQ